MKEVLYEVIFTCLVSEGSTNAAGGLEGALAGWLAGLPCCHHNRHSPIQTPPVPTGRPAGSIG